MHLKFDTLVAIHVCYPRYHVLYSSLYFSEIFGECTSGTGWLSPNFLQSLSPMMFDKFIEQLVFQRGHLMDFVLQALNYPLLISI
jgi:hypothetical protein